MFGFFKKKIDKNIYAPVSGKCIDIREVSDKVFANKMMGDGFAIIPNEEIITSPCKGVITMIFPTKHAFGIKMDDGKEILVHIGIDTVSLNGKGFKCLRKVNDKVNPADPVIQIDMEEINKMGYDLSVMIIVTNPMEIELNKTMIGENVNKKDLIIDFN